MTPDQAANESLAPTSRHAYTGARWSQMLLAGAAWVRRPQAWFGILAAFVIVRGLLFMAVVPPWQGPDEPGHFEYVALIERLGRIPSPRPNVETVPDLTIAINESALAQRFEHFHRNVNLREQSAQSPPLLVGPREAGYQRPTYYLLVLPIYWLLKSQPILVQYYGVALVSVGLGVVTVLAAAGTARTLLPDDRWGQRVIPLLVAFWPTQSYMLTRVTNDNLATAAAAVTFWLGATLMRHGLRLIPSLAFVTALILAAYTKGTSLFLVGFGVLVFGYVLVRHFFARGLRWADWALSALCLTGLILAGLTLFYPPAAEQMLNLVRRLPDGNRVVGFLTNVLRTLAAGIQWRPDRVAANINEAGFTLRTFWAVFGWGSFFLPAGWYSAAAAAGGVAVLGWLRLAWLVRRGSSGWEGWQGRTLGLLALSIPLALVPLVSRMIFDPFDVAYHGRILQTLLTPVTVLLAVGWRQWLRPVWRPGALVGLVLGLLLVDAVVFTNVLLPRFYQ